MARTKGSTNKVANSSNDTPKPRGRQKGSPPIERKPSVIIEIDKIYRMKMDEYNFTLQKKISSKEKIEEIDEENEDANYKIIGHYPPRTQGLIHICNAIIGDLTLNKARKEKIVTFEKWSEFYNKIAEKVIKNFPNFDSLILKLKG